MLIQDAIRMNEPMRRKGWPDDGIWIEGRDGDDVFLDSTAPEDEPRSVPISVTDILADDWEVQSGRVQISIDPYPNKEADGYVFCGKCGTAI